MTCKIANSHALSDDVQQPAGAFIAGRVGKRSVGMRARVFLACVLTAAVALLGLVAWFNPTEWRELLLFGCIVGIAALSGGRAVPVAASRRQEDTLDQAPEEPIA